MKTTIFLLILAISTTSAGDNVIFSDDFESGTLDQWIIGGRQRDGHGGINIAEVIYRNSSQMAHIHHSLDTTEITLEKLLEYCPNLIFNFDMEVSVSSIAGPTDDDYAMGGAFFDFLDSSGELIGFVRYICSTSSYPFTTENPSPSRECIALPDSSLHSYSFTLEDILSHITVDTDSIAYINFSFWAYNSGWGWNMSADVWVDNVVVSVPELVGLVSHWKFDDGSGDIAYDSAGSNDGTVYGAQWADGIIEGALDFDGVDDYVDVGDKASLDFGADDSFSISAWISTHGVDAPIVNKRRCGEYGGVWYEGYNFWVSQDKLYFGIEDTSSKYTHIFGNTIVSDDQWHHVAAVRDTTADKLYIYVDGGPDATEVTDATTETLATSKSFEVGHRDSTVPPGYVYYEGTMDDIRIYDRALSLEEIQQLYQSGAGNVVALEIIGPDYVAENFRANYKAIAYYDNNETKDVTHSVLWAVEPNTYADINDNGALTTKDISEDQLVVILADYAVGNAIFEAEKVVDIFPICPTGTALSFDGVDDYVDVEDRDSLDFGPSDSFSISAWISTHEVDAPIVNKRRCGGVWYEGYNFWVSQDKLYFGIEDTSSGYTKIFGNTIISDDKWHHVAAVRDTAEDKLYIYLDGSPDATPVTDATTETLATSTSFHIGHRESTVSPGHVYCEGMIDEVAIYNRAFSAEEIRANMHIRLQGDEPGLVGYWDFDEGEGQIVYDLSGNGNDGQLGSTPNPDAGDPTWIESDAPVGLCTPYLITKMAINRAIKHKLASLEELQAALAQEAISIDALDELIKSGDFGNLERRHLLKAKSTIHKTILAEKLCSRRLKRTIRDLKIALAALDGKVPPPGWPKLDMEIELEMADVSADGVVDLRDFAMLANQWLKSYQQK